MVKTELELPNAASFIVLYHPTFCFVNPKCTSKAIWYVYIYIIFRVYIHYVYCDLEFSHLHKTNEGRTSKSTCNLLKDRVWSDVFRVGWLFVWHKGARVFPQMPYHFPGRSSAFPRLMIERLQPSNAWNKESSQIRNLWSGNSAKRNLTYRNSGQTNLKPKNPEPHPASLRTKDQNALNQNQKKTCKNQPLLPLDLNKKQLQFLGFGVRIVVLRVRCNLRWNGFASKLCCRSSSKTSTAIYCSLIDFSCNYAQHNQKCDFMRDYWDSNAPNTPTIARAEMCSSFNQVSRIQNITIRTSETTIARHRI